MSLLLSTWSSAIRLRRARRSNPLPAGIGMIVATAAMAATVFGVIVITGGTIQHPALYRPLAAVLLAGGLILLGIGRPMAAASSTMVFLTLLALIRRLLIPAAGWTSYDPLLLVAPVVSAFLVLRLFTRRERRPVDRLTALTLALLLLTIVEAANPLGSGLLAGIGGLLFLAAPLLWFFVGELCAQRVTITRLLAVIVLLGAAIAIYGLEQTSAGFLPWDAAWVRLGGYTALFVHADLPVNKVLRAFGTFSSSGEYATFLAIALIVAAAFALHRRLIALLAVPVVAWALFMDSSRGIVIQTALAVMVLAGLRTRNLALGALVIVVSAGAAIAAVQTWGQAAQADAVQNSNLLVVHQLEGLTHPLDPQSSTLFRHWDGLLGGVKHGFQSPLGLGTGITTLAGDKLGSGASGTELDATNEIASLGLLGGALFIGIVVIVFKRLFLLYLRDADAASAAAIGVLIVTLGQWLNGGQYAVAPLVWLLIGWGNRQWLRRNLILTGQPAHD